MLNATCNLRLAPLAVGAEVLGLALDTHQLGAALGTVGDILKWLAIGRSLRELYLGNLGYYLAPLLDIDHIAYAYIERSYLVGIVYRCAAYDGASQLHWLEVGYGRDSTCAAYLEVDT